MGQQSKWFTVVFTAVCVAPVVGVSPMAGALVGTVLDKMITGQQTDGMRLTYTHPQSALATVDVVETLSAYVRVMATQEQIAQVLQALTGAGAVFELDTVSLYTSEDGWKHVSVGISTHASVRGGVIDVRDLR